MEKLSAKLQSPLLGVPLKCNVFERISKGDYASLNGINIKPFRKGSNFQTCKCAKKRDWIFQRMKFTHFYGIELLWRNLELRSGWMINSVKEPFTRSKTLIKSITPVCKEGLFLFRCSVLFTVISGLCLLVWYGQLKAKNYVEGKLLPSVCAMLSDQIQRQLDFGKVRRISPLSITLESCSFGPHGEEFSCGEASAVKLRIRPFASLRRGKIVVDAVLSDPSFLVVQKKNFTWLGLPYSEGSRDRHLSAEEGIDYRTKTRRIAKEEAAIRWDTERDERARESAEKGYILSECNHVQLEDDNLKESMSIPERLATPEPLLYMDEKLHWRDHHCMEAGAEYDLKHADLEKSFGSKVSSAETSIWSTIMPGPMRRSFKKQALNKYSSILRVASKRRLLERSAYAARFYIQRQLFENRENSTDESEGFNDRVASNYSMNSEGEERAEPQDVKVGSGKIIDGDDENVQVTENVSTSKVMSQQDNWKKFFVSGVNLEGRARSPTNSLTSLRDPFLFTLDKLRVSTKSSDEYSSPTNSLGIIDTNKRSAGNEVLETGDINRGTEARNEDARLVEEQREPQNDILTAQAGHTCSESSPMSLDPSSSIQQFLLSLHSGLSSVFKNFGEAWSGLLVNRLQRLKSEIFIRFDDISMELVDDINSENASGIEKMIPVIFDSLHFKGGTFMLLAYGDAEPR